MQRLAEKEEEKERIEGRGSMLLLFVVVVKSLYCNGIGERGEGREG